MKISKSRLAAARKVILESLPVHQGVGDTYRPWLMTSDAYLRQMGIHDLWIAEISPMQYALLPKRQKHEYDLKRARDWDIVSKARITWANEVYTAFKAQEFALSDPGISGEVKNVVFRRGKFDREEVADDAYKLAQKDNEIKRGQLKVGDVVFSRVVNHYGAVTKLSTASAWLSKAVDYSWPTYLAAGVKAPFSTMYWVDPRELKDKIYAQHGVA